MAGIGRGKDDATLVKAAQAGDHASMNTLLTQHYDRIYSICRRMTGNDADAADAAQEALISVAKGLPKYTFQASFSTWSYRVATNACLDEMRKRGRRPLPAFVDETPGFVERATSDTSPSLGEQVTDRLVLDAAIAQLPEEFRAPVVLRDHAGLDYAEIAEVLQIPPGTVRSRIARGRKRLAHLLQSGNQTGPAERQNPLP